MLANSAGDRTTPAVVAFSDQEKVSGYFTTDSAVLYVPASVACPQHDRYSLNYRCDTCTPGCWTAC